MNPLTTACFILLLLLCVNSDDIDDKKVKYNGDDPNDNKTCKIEWETSLMPEPFTACWIFCKVRCIILSRTGQWRCKKLGHDIFGNCHCCSGEFQKLYII